LEGDPGKPAGEGEADAEQIGLRRWLLDGEATGSKAPLWYQDWLVARELGIKPWETASVPAVWWRRAKVAMNAEAEAKEILRQREEKALAEKRRTRK
jgi:hypothetical protein